MIKLCLVFHMHNVCQSASPNRKFVEKELGLSNDWLIRNLSCVSVNEMCYMYCAWIVRLNVVVP
jgi:hypothetical protein